MAMHSKWDDGHLIFYDGQRWLDVLGPDVVKLVENFQEWNVDNTTGFPTAYTTTAVNGSTVALTPAAGGNMIMTADTAENDGIQIQLAGESFKFDGAYPAYCGCRFKVADADQTDVSIGLVITDTSVASGFSDGVAFGTADESAALSIAIAKDSTVTTAAIGTLLDDTFVTIEFIFNGTYIDIWVDGVEQTRPAITNLPDDEELTPSIAMLTGEAVANTVTIDWFRCFQIR